MLLTTVMTHSKSAPWSSLIQHLHDLTSGQRLMLQPLESVMRPNFFHWLLLETKSENLGASWPKFFPESEALVDRDLSKWIVLPSFPITVWCLVNSIIYRWTAVQNDNSLHQTCCWRVSLKSCSSRYTILSSHWHTHEACSYMRYKVHY